MAPAILLVDDQRDILRLLHSALDTLRNPELEIMEAGSAEAALQALAGRSADLLVTDYNLPGLNGMELTQAARLTLPDLRVIMITGNTDRKVRDDMLKAGAVAVFSKPVPLGDFLDAVERGLSLTRTILPVEAEAGSNTGSLSVTDILSEFRQEFGADGVFLVSNRGLVVARAGDLRASSMEVSLISALTATFAASLKVASSNRQETLNQFSVFGDGDQDLILMPVDASYSLILAGAGFSNPEALPDTLRSMRLIKEQLAKNLRNIGPAAPPRKKRGKTGKLEAPSPEMEA